MPDKIITQMTQIKEIFADHISGNPANLRQSAAQFFLSANSPHL